MIKKQILLVVLVAFMSQFAFSATISGTIMSPDSSALPFSTVYVKNTTYGVTADYYGKYFIQLKPGSYTLIFSCLGSQSVEKQVVVQSSNLKIDMILPNSDVQIPQVEVVANKKDKGKEILIKVRDKRRDYLFAVDNFECNSYVKTSIEKEFEEEKVDSLIPKKDFTTFLKTESMNLIEYVAKTYFKRPEKYKEIISGYHDFTESKPFDYSVNVEVGGTYGEHDIAPHQYMPDNPFLFYQNITSGDFNFYKNQISIPNLCSQPLVSPIAYNSAVYYNFYYETSFYQDSVKIYKIKVEPRNKVSALFYGSIYVEDSTWALRSVDLNINEQALLIYKNFNIIQNYQKLDDSIYLPIRTEITYTIKNGKETITGNTKIIRQDYLVNQPIDKKVFNNEVIVYQPDAMDKDSVFWQDTRPIALKYTELRFVKNTDSIRTYYLSDEYLDKQDSTFNHFNWWSPFVGVGYKNHYSGITFWLDGLINQMNPFGIGGYRHKLSFYLNKRFQNGMLLETKPFIDYGFRNEDLKGKFGVGLTYLPLKFVRTYVEFGDYYDMINTYSSFEQIFSRSNYVENKFFSIKQRMEIVNGLYAELSFKYSNQLPIDNLQLSNWSTFVFGEVNTPIDFDQYIKCETKLELKYVPGQKYVIRNNRKIIIGSDLPEINFIYRKGIPDLLKSEVNFDYVELGSKGIFKLSRWGESRWQIKAGMFTNKKSLRVLEYKYFRGSDEIFFSSPVSSMQLLPNVFSTNNSFLQANFIHHFNGSVLCKVPLFKYLKLSIAAGGGSLNIPDENFYQMEMFAGLEKIFRIKTQLFRFGLYGVTADNNLSAADFSIKFGISVFDAYKKKWDY